MFMKKIKIYVIARISEDAHFWTDKVCNKLDEKFDIFKPKDHNPWNKRHELFPKRVFDVDLKAMQNSHLGLMLPKYGNDCSWEAGWYFGMNKPVVLFIDTQMKWLKDWMIKGGTSYIVTNNKDTYKILKKDPILKYKKIFLIDAMEELNGVLEEIYHIHYHNKA